MYTADGWLIVLRATETTGRRFSGGPGTNAIRIRPGIGTFDLTSLALAEDGTEEWITEEEGFG